ncbi:MAG: SPOR domain-containing protein [Paracoccaceae bacterium]
MLLKIASAAVLAAVIGASSVASQTLDQIGGPRELPPSSFKGQMYVDSRGCVFLRAGYGGQQNWVPRVSKDRKVLCGYPPTLASLGKPLPQDSETDVVVAAPAPTPAPVARVATGKPMETIASLTTAPKIRATAAQAPAEIVNYAAPAVTLPQAPVRQVQAPMVQAISAGSTGNKIGCYTSAPVPVRVATSNGGSAVLCTRGDGSFTGARAPIYATVAQVGNRIGAGLYEPAGGLVTRSSNVASATAPQVYATAAVAPIKVPKGYKLAWTDDRLNPNRGVGTVAGQAAQDQIWTQEVPAVLVAAQPKGTARVVKVRRVVVSSQSVPQVVVSTKSDATARVVAPATQGKFYVQVGTFGVPANAEGAKTRLRSAGLPVGTAKISKAGKPLQIVLAGPFADSGSAQAALSAARGAGFGDAFIR